METELEEALRYLGVPAPVPEELRALARTALEQISAAAPPRWTFRVFPLEAQGGSFSLTGSGLVLTGDTAARMLGECSRAALMACTLGPRFDAMLRREQIRDMGRAAVLDACGSARVETGCDRAEAQLREMLPGQYLTDRFSPGYGDLPLSLQRGLCAALDAERRLGLTVTHSLMLDPVKSVTAVIGIADTPQMARVRGCDRCALRETCTLRKAGDHCEL